MALEKGKKEKWLKVQITASPNFMVVISNLRFLGAKAWVSHPQNSISSSQGGNGRGFSCYRVMGMGVSALLGPRVLFFTPPHSWKLSRIVRNNGWRGKEPGEIMIPSTPAPILWPNWCTFF